MPEPTAEAATTPEILRRLGATVHVINEPFDGTFPGRMPEPTAEGLAPLSKKVVETGAAFGVAHDGDADRAIFVDEHGTFMDGNITLGLVASYFCRRHPGGIVVTPVSTSGVVEAVAESHGCTTTKATAAPQPTPSSAASTPQEPCAASWKKENLSSSAEKETAASSTLLTSSAVTAA